ncbi:lytic transglycosylase domain-containing protein [Streptomyces sp. NPDC023723]|uniref:aggregation-promoting factor C-terminal-like domain-containing protein n=1 Tax=Streptomyces sp. NPDC023723 TaxID=3154323 RepID=UPI0033C54E5C
MSRISVRGFAVASATAVTAVGSVVGVASGSTMQGTNNDAEATASGTTLLADIPAGQQAQVQTASLTQQADAQAIAADAGAKKEAEEAARKAAAETAVAKKKEADDAAKKAAQAAKEREEEEQEASRSSTRDASDFTVQSSYSTAEIQAMARQMVPSAQFQCFSNIVDHESSWNYTAVNASSGAYGLFQALPASKYSSAGSDWQTNPATQIKWGLNYMDSRYGSPCEAWTFWQANSWY